MYKGIFAFFLLLLVTASFAVAEEGYVAGKVFDIDKVTPLKDVVIHLTSLDSGKTYDVESKDEGCYSFKKIPEGTYSVSVTVNGKDYLLPDKIIVDVAKEKIVVAVCVALAENGALVMLEKCHVCLGGGIPPVAWIGGAVGAAVITGIALSGDEEEPVASPFTP